MNTTFYDVQMSDNTIYLGIPPIMGVLSILTIELMYRLVDKYKIYFDLWYNKKSQNEIDQMIKSTSMTSLNDNLTNEFSDL